jgi:hypothetical protein
VGSTHCWPPALRTYARSPDPAAAVASGTVAARDRVATDCNTDTPRKPPSPDVAAPPPLDNNDEVDEADEADEVDEADEAYEVEEADEAAEAGLVGRMGAPRAAVDARGT